MPGPYRDDTAALHGRIATLDRRVAELEAGFTRFFWEKRSERYGLEPPRPSEASSARNVETAAADLESLEQRVESLEQLRSKMTVIEEVRLGLPSNPPKLEILRDVDPSEIDDAMDDLNVVIFRREIERVARHVDLSPLKRGGVGGPADVDGIPLCAVCTRRTEQGARPWDSTIQLGTSVPVALGMVEIGVSVPQSKPVSTGDRAFDGLFAYHGSLRTTLALTNAKVRRSLLEIAKQDVPTVRIGTSEAWVEWCAEPNKRALEAAIIVLRAARRLEPPRLMR